jgi:hypothetical protein
MAPTSPAPIRELGALLRGLRPARNPGVYAFAVLPEGAPLAGLAPLATFREAEGLSMILEEEAALRAGLSVRFRAAWLTLTVASDLAAIGLTAAVAAAMTAAGIACNVVAAVHHDHLFVPVEDADRALATLAALHPD